MSITHLDEDDDLRAEYDASALTEGVSGKHLERFRAGTSLALLALDQQSDVLHRLREIHRLCPEMRLGQLLATIGMLGEDSTGHGLWEIEDADLADAVERLASDLRRRTDS